jgi:hypothetical protein
VGIVYLDKDNFDAQLKVLQSAGDSFQKAKKTFHCSVNSSGEVWSELSELRQFDPPLRASLLTVNRQLGEISLRYENVVLNLKKAVMDFDDVDAAQRITYMEELAGLTDQFSYTSPEWVADLQAKKTADDEGEK